MHPRISVLLLQWSTWGIILRYWLYVTHMITTHLKTLEVILLANFVNVYILHCQMYQEPPRARVSQHMHVFTQKYEWIPYNYALSLCVATVCHDTAIWLTEIRCWLKQSWQNHDNHPKFEKSATSVQSVEWLNQNLMHIHTCIIRWQNISRLSRQIFQEFLADQWICTNEILYLINIQCGYT